jgi:hypothetical protein
MATPAEKPASKYDDYDYPTTAPEAQPGHPGHTSPEQDAKVDQLRSELEQEGYVERLDTLTLLRFLRARKFDVAATKTMYDLHFQHLFNFQLSAEFRLTSYVPRM